MVMVEPFYIDTTGAWVLGHNQTYGTGSYLQAGARAEKVDTPFMQALSTFGGRIASRTMQYMFRGDVTKLLNYAAFRPHAIKFAVDDILGDQAKEKIVLDPAGGLSPAFYWLAQAHKETHFIEMDIEKVITHKQRVLKAFNMPANLHLQSVNLKEQHLHEVQSVSVDAIVTLGAYVSRADFREMLRYLQRTLNSDGYVIATFPYRKGIENFQENSAIFSRIVTTPKGVIDDEKDIYAVFKDTDFTVTKIIKLSELAEAQGADIPADIEIVAIAKLGDIPPTFPQVTRQIAGEQNGKPVDLSDHLVESGE